MRKVDGKNHKEATIKTIWNTTAKMLVEKCFEQYKRIINSFEDIAFKTTKEARNSKRKELYGTRV